MVKGRNKRRAGRVKGAQIIQLYRLDMLLELFCFPNGVRTQNVQGWRVDRELSDGEPVPTLVIGAGRNQHTNLAGRFVFVGNLLQIKKLVSYASPRGERLDIIFYSCLIETCFEQWRR